MKELILALDIGTSALKAVLFNSDGCKVDSASMDYPVHYAPGGFAEEDPSDWWNAAITCIHELTERLSDQYYIAVVSLSGHMSGATFLDRFGNPSRPAILWLDTRPVEQAKKLRELPYDYFAIAGRQPGVRPAEKVMWVHENEPEVYNNTAIIFQAKDYIAYKLTDNIATDFSDASITGFFDLRTNSWSDEMAEITDIDKRLLPETVIYSTEIVGKVTPEASRLTGIPQGTPVAIGGGDSACAAVGAGCVRKNSAYISIGSSAWVCSVLDHQFPDGQRTYSTLHALPGLYLNHCNISTAGISYKWMVETILNCTSADFDKINEQIMASPPGASGIFYMPYLMGDVCLHDAPHATAGFLGITANTNRGDICRAVIEGVSRYLYEAVNLFFDASNMPETIVLTGGAVSGEPWRRIMCDMLGTNCSYPAYYKEMSSIGAALIGGIAVNMFKDFDDAAKHVHSGGSLDPDINDHAIYEMQRPMHEKLYQALDPCFHELFDFTKISSNAKRK